MISLINYHFTAYLFNIILSTVRASFYTASLLNRAKAERLLKQTFSDFEKRFIWKSNVYCSAENNCVNIVATVQSERTDSVTF